MRIKDLTGMRFGRLTVLSLAYTKNKKSYWNVKCDCGTIKVVRSDCLTTTNLSKRTVSCGCYCAEINTNRVRIHDEARTKLYRVFYSMKERCYNKNSTSYVYYGARGIKICQEWLDDYTTFSKWAKKHGYREGLTIERIDVNGDYCPENCTWISMCEQNNNTRRTLHITYQGRTMNINQWAKELGINKNTLWHRLRGANPKSIEEAFTTPIKCND